MLVLFSNVRVNFRRNPRFFLLLPPSSRLAKLTSGFLMGDVVTIGFVSIGVVNDPCGLSVSLRRSIFVTASLVTSFLLMLELLSGCGGLLEGLLLLSTSTGSFFFKGDRILAGNLSLTTRVLFFTTVFLLSCL